MQYVIMGGMTLTCLFFMAFVVARMFSPSRVSRTAMNRLTAMVIATICGFSAYVAWIQSYPLAWAVGYGVTSFAALIWLVRELRSGHPPP